MKFGGALFEDTNVEFYKDGNELKVSYREKEYDLRSFLKLRMTDHAVNSIIEKMVEWAKKNFKLTSYDEIEIIRQLFAHKNNTPDVRLSYDGISFDFREAMSTSAGRLGNMVKTVRGDT